MIIDVRVVIVVEVTLGVGIIRHLQAVETRALPKACSWEGSTTVGTLTGTTAGSAFLLFTGMQIVVVETL